MYKQTYYHLLIKQWLFICIQAAFVFVDQTVIICLQATFLDRKWLSVYVHCTVQKVQIQFFLKAALVVVDQTVVICKACPIKNISFQILSLQYIGTWSSKLTNSCPYPPLYNIDCQG